MLPDFTSQEKTRGWGFECVLQVPTVSFLHRRSFQNCLIRQPVKLGGLGLRSMQETSQAAFIGGVEMSLPHFAGDGGICPLLENQVGRVEGGDRWQTFLAAGCRAAN